MNEQFKLGYAFGLIVGEGSFTQSPPTLSVKLHQDDPEPLLFLKALWGGRVYGPYRNLGKDGVERRYLVWHLRGRALSRALPLIWRSLPPSRKRGQFRLWASRHRLSVARQQELVFHVPQKQKPLKKSGESSRQLRLIG